MFLCTLNLCLLNGIFRPLTFTVITDIVDVYHICNCFLFVAIDYCSYFYVPQFLWLLWFYWSMLWFYFFFFLSIWFVFLFFFIFFFTFLLVVLECAIYITNIMDPWRKWELEALISSCPLMVENQQLVLHIHGSTTVFQPAVDCGALWYVFTEKKCRYIWTHTVQTHVIQGSTVIQVIFRITLQHYTCSVLLTTKWP